MQVVKWGFSKGAGYISDHEIVLLFVASVTADANASVISELNASSSTVGENVCQSNLYQSHM